MLVRAALFRLVALSERARIFGLSVSALDGELAVYKPVIALVRDLVDGAGLGE